MKKLHIKLEYNNRIIYQIDFADVESEIIIGRSKTCDWTIPDKKGGLSSRHVSLMPKKGAVILTDLDSTNGVFLNGKRISKRKLSLHDKIAFAGCLLCVELSKTKDEKSYSELVLLSGKEKGKRYKLIPPIFTIGSDPDSSLPLMDMLVSRKHAEITVKEDGSCWIIDCGSKNGTSVNNMPLRNKERLLKDADKILIAQFELEFNDGAIKKINSNAWTKILVIIATVLLVCVGYYVYLRLQPDAEFFLKKAEKTAADAHFSMAAILVERAANARDAEKFCYKIPMLRNNISLWKSTKQSWEDALSALDNKKWQNASEKLTTLNNQQLDAWHWDLPESQRLGVYAKQTKKLLDCYLDAKGIPDRENVSYDNIVDNYTQMKNIVDFDYSGYPECVSNLKADLVGLLPDYKRMINDYDRFNDALNELPEAVNREEVFQRIIDFKSDYHVIQSYRNKIMPALKSLSDAYDKLLEMSGFIADMNFKEALGLDIQLPSAQACAVDYRISETRSIIEGQYNQVLQSAANLNMLYGKISRTSPEDYINAFSVEQLNPVVQCDTLQYPFNRIRRSREKPVGEYDRYLGVEEFSGYLKALPEKYDINDVMDIKFTPLIREFKVYLYNVNNFLDYVDKQPWLKKLYNCPLSGKISELKKAKSDVEKLTNELLTQAEKSTKDRDKVIYAGMACRISEKPLRIDDMPLEEWIKNIVESKKEEVKKRRREYNSASWEGQVEIRDTIIDIWLPGDSTVKNMWSKRPSN